MPTYKNSETNKWYCKFYYFDHEGNKKQKKKSGFTFKKDAQQWERDFLLSKQFEPDITFGSFLEIYKKDKYPKLRISSRDKKECRYKRILPYFKNKPINKISNKDISNWQNKMIESGFRSTYIKGLQGEISAVLNHAVRFYGLRINPCKIVGYAKVPDEIPTKMRYWTYDEYLKAIDSITDLKSKTAINLLYWTGMRKGELYALTWDKLDLDNKTILIDRSLQRLNGKSIVTMTKTYESRLIKLPDTTIKQLKEYKEHCYDANPNDYIFEWEKRFIENGIKQAHISSGVPAIHVHGLRHSHASFLISQGVNVVLVAKRLGHKDIKMTLNTYSHFFPTDENNLIENINKLNN